MCPPMIIYYKFNSTKILISCNWPGDVCLYLEQFLNKRNPFLKEFRILGFSLSEPKFIFQTISYTLVILEKYPRRVLMKNKKLVILLEILDFFQKKDRFPKKSEIMMGTQVSPCQIIKKFKQVNKLKHLSTLHIY